MKPSRAVAYSLALAFIASVLACGPASTGPLAKAMTWQTSYASLGFSAAGAGWNGLPSTSESLVFLDGGRDVYALDFESGRLRWNTSIWPFRTAGSQSMPVTERFLFTSRYGRAAMLDPTTGAVLWRVEIDSLEAGVSAAIAGDIALTGTRDLPELRIIALEATTGRTRWTTVLGAGWEFPSYIDGFAASGDTVYLTATRYLTRWGQQRAGIVAALDRDTGRELWRFQTPGALGHFSDAPTVTGALLLVSDPGTPAIFAIDRASGREVWRIRSERGFVGSYKRPQIAGDTVFFGSGDTKVYAADLATGRVLWTAGATASVDQIALCGRWILANTQAINVFDRGTGRRLGVLLGAPSSDYDDGRPPGSGFPTSGFAVAPLPGGDFMAIVAGTQDVYGIRCPS